MSARADRKKRLAEAMAQKAATKPAEVGEAAHIPGRGRAVQTAGRHEIGMKLEQVAKARKAAGRAPKVVEAAEAAKMTGKVRTVATKAAQFAGRIPKTPVRLAARPLVRAAEAVAKKIPFVSRAAAPMTGFIAKRVMGPVGLASDVAATADVAYTGYKALEERASLAERAKKLKVPIKRRAIGSVLLEALTKENADMDPGIKVYNPKTKRWD